VFAQILASRLRMADEALVKLKNENTMLREVINKLKPEFNVGKSTATQRRSD
jgi:hypothetical protein